MGLLAPVLARSDAFWRGVSGGTGLSCKSTCCYLHYYNCHICTICSIWLDLAAPVRNCPIYTCTIGG